MTVLQAVRLLRKLFLIMLVWNIMLTCSIIGMAVGNSEQKQEQTVKTELPPLEVIEELNV